MTVVVVPAAHYEDECSVWPVALSGFDELDTDWLVKSCLTDYKMITEPISCYLRRGSLFA